MKNRCSSFVRLSKTTFLAMMGIKPYKKNAFFDEFGVPITGKKLYERYLNKDYPFNPYKDDEKFSSSKQRSFFEKIKYDWQIISFDPATRLVCIQINDPVRTKTVSVILPNLYLF